MSLRVVKSQNLRILPPLQTFDMYMAYSLLLFMYQNITWNGLIHTDLVVIAKNSVRASEQAALE